MPRSSVWSKDFVIIFFASFFVALNFYLLMTTMTLYAIEAFAVSKALGGLAAGIFIIGALAARVVTGRYMEAIGRTRTLYGSLSLFLVAALAYLPADSLGILLAVRFVHGIAFGVATTAMPTIILDIVPRARRGEGIAFFSLAPTLATAVGPFIGIFILQHADFRMMFIFCAAVSAMSLAMVPFLRIPEAPAPTPGGAARTAGWRDYFEESAIPVSAIMLLMGVAFSGIIAFLNAYAIEIGQAETSGFFFLVYALFILASRPFTGRLLDLRGDNIVMYPALLSFAAGLGLLALADRGIVLLTAGAFAGLGFGTVMSCGQAIATKDAPPHRVALATATFFFCADLGLGVGPYLVGHMIPAVGFRGMYVVLALVALLSALLYHFVHGRRQAPPS